MRPLAIGAVYLLLAGMAAGRCTVVEVSAPQVSSRHVEITVLRDSKPLRDARVIVFTGDKLRFSIATGEGCTARLLSLPPGPYHIVATDSGGLSADLLLDISDAEGKKTSFFWMDLVAKPTLSSLTLSQKIAIAESQAGREKLKDFEGVVVDASGAVVPGAKIEIFQLGSLGKAQAAQIETNDVGHFLIHLGDGSYTAIVQWPGFSKQVQVFDISEVGNKRDLRIELQVASCV